MVLVGCILAFLIVFRPHRLSNKNGTVSGGSAILDAGPAKEASPPPITLINSIKTAPSRESITTSIGLTLKLMPAGEFMMGSPEGDTGAGKAERPQHPVRITPFYLGVTEVTQRQYQAVMGKNPSCFSPTGNGRTLVLGRSTEQLPVENVGWHDAIRFCNALSQRYSLKTYYDIAGDTVRIPDRKANGLPPADGGGVGICLPGGKHDAVLFGDDPSSLGDYAWYEGNASGRPIAGRSGPMRSGLFDMHGNVWEWCWDNLDAQYYARSPVIDPSGPSGAWGWVIRGGSWRQAADFCRSALAAESPSSHNGDLGFRVALSQSRR